MTIEAQRIQDFVDYVHALKGDEKGEAQVFCDRLFQAFGHKGFKEAGATLEERIQIKDASGKVKSTKFADLVWKPRLLLEMKKRGENLQKHYLQAFEYWQRLVPHRPRYVMLCNFDEFWIYDFDLQLDEPVDRIALDEMTKRASAFNFLLPLEKPPLFKNNRVTVTREAADKVARVFNSLKDNYKKDRASAQRFVLQCVVAMFSEDVGLLPQGLFSQMLADCRNDKSQSYDLFLGLFRQMNDPQPAIGGRFENVAYFNGGLFSQPQSFPLYTDHITFLSQAAEEDWSRVQPAIFGTLFQASMDKGARHAFGAHFTSEADIQKVVLPTIVRPWREQLENAQSFAELEVLHAAWCAYRVLDPSCGSGNFLYVAYREMKRLESELLQRCFALSPDKTRAVVAKNGTISTQQFFGLDLDPFAVELAKVTLMLAKELAALETHAQIEAGLSLPRELEKSLPLDNLDDNIRCDDALFCDWPQADAIIGNPPYQSKNKMQSEYGAAYVNRVREKYPAVPGRADYCVYWFRRAHDELPPNGRAGLVGTNTIRQNYSREGGLDYIVGNGGTIVEAVSSEVWSGEAAVHVSIVNWIKGEDDGLKTLWTQLGDNAQSPWRKDELAWIPSSLSSGTDVTQARRLRVNIESECCYQGQTHGHEGFLLKPNEARQMIEKNPRNRDVLFPYLIAEDLIGQKNSQPTRWVIDFGQRDVFEAQSYKEPFAQVEKRVLPTVRANSEKVIKESGKTVGPRQSHLNNWWKFWRPRNEMLSRIAQLPRYIVCGRVTKRPIFEFVSHDIRPNDAVMVFALEDDYSFGILQSSTHWLWFMERCSTMKGDFRYTSDSVWDTFVWPQTPTLAQVERVAQAAKTLRHLRRDIMEKSELSLREIGRILDKPGKNPLRDAQDLLDRAVRDAYGMKQNDDVLAHLLELNARCAALEDNGEIVVAPGLPPSVLDTSLLISNDCLTPLFDLE